MTSPTSPKQKVNSPLVVRTDLLECLTRVISMNVQSFLNTNIIAQSLKLPGTKVAITSPAVFWTMQLALFSIRGRDVKIHADNPEYLM